MVDVLSAVVVAVALAAAVYALTTAVRGRAMSGGHLVVLTTLELLVLVQAAVGFVKLSGDGRPEGGTATFVGYLLGVLLIPVAGAAWGLLERTRWGPAVIVVAGVAVAVMVVRLDQLWGGGGG